MSETKYVVFDKTGTLTQNKMTVKKLCPGGQIIPTDGADFVRRTGYRNFPAGTLTAAFR